MPTDRSLPVYEALQTLIPELRESEDEIIQKDIINLIYWLKGNPSLCSQYYNDRYDIMLAWLEKQKEQKPIPKFSVGDYVIDTNYKGEPLYQIVGMDKECYICEYRGDKEIGDRTVMHFAFNNPYLRLEQKPAEWSKQSIIDALTKWLTEKIVPLHKKSLDGTITEREEMFMAALLEIRSFVNSPDFQIGEDTSAEWSEEDEKTFWGLTAYIPNEELERLGITRDDILKKLKSLRPQPIQLKEAYKDGFQTARHVIALVFMNYLDENRPDGKMCLSNGECEDIDKAFKVGDWAKIMRYYEKYRSSWKPSEKQMKHLHYALTPGSAFDLDILNELYEQLKKL